MCIINKYLLDRGIIDDEFLWQAPQSRFQHLQSIRNQPSKQNIIDGFYNGLRQQQQNQIYLIIVLLMIILLIMK